MPGAPWIVRLSGRAVVWGETEVGAETRGRRGREELAMD